MGLKDAIEKASTQQERDTAVMRMSAQQDIAQKLQGSETLNELLSRTSEVRSLVEADWVFAWALDAGTLVTSDPSGADVRVPIEQAGIPGHCARTSEVVNIADVYDQDALHRINPMLSFNVEADKASGYRTKQVLCTPVIYRGGLIGVIQAINKLNAEKFNFLDVETLNEVSRSLGPLMQRVIDLDRQGQRLRYQENLNKIINSIHAARDVDQILISLIQDIAALFDSERVTVYAVDTETGELFSRTKMGDEIREFRVAVNNASIAGYAANARTAITVADVYDADELARIHPELSFNRSFDEKSGFRTMQVLAAPIEFQGDLMGALQLINRADGQPYAEEDVERAKLLAETLGIAFSNQERAGARRTKFNALVEAKLVSKGDLNTAKETAKEEGSSIEAVLMSEFKVPKNALLDAYADFYRTGTFEFDSRMVVPQGLVQKLGEKYDELKFACAVPIEEDGRKVVVAIDDPKDVVKRDHVQALFGDRRIQYRVATQEDIVATIDLFFGTGGGDQSVSDLLSQMEVESDVVGPDEEEETEASEDDSAVVKLVNRIIEDAYRRGASDIHIEPAIEGEAIVRYRVDGAMQKVMTFPRAYRNAILSRIKIMSDLDIAERRKPQSGKIKFKKWGKLDVELRVECLPTVGTEDAVMRILASSKPLPIQKLAMSERNLEEFKKLVDTPYGIVLCVGPTGSGKTTTLHSALGYINKEDVKIWTAEDPVEITQRGLRQMQMNRKAGVTFASAMRSFLRADPDVIMIGEMRDEETAQTGIEASLTGHLVFSTLHTNSAPETVTRLIEMGIDPYSFADAMLGVLAQRLVRTLCKKCKEEYKITKKELANLRDEYGAPELFDELGYKAGHKIYRAHKNGCVKCSKVGFRGRMGIHELLVNTDDIKSLMYRKAKAMEIRDLAIEQGMRTLKQDGIEKVLGGFTTLDEVRGVCSR
ncbi:MAG: ATPase, T2SS/T4P/T4SS family [Planctomycetota bacterium]|jgi:type II secretory ATPase GspE/PulE/Tfp pilus assembly ATPase PilB-like protein/GAF domain-containing protein